MEHGEQISIDDRSQRMIFGWYRYTGWRPDGTLATVAEGLIYADDLPERDSGGYAQLVEYAKVNRAEVESGDPSQIALLSRRAFLDEVLWPAIQAEALIVGFNLPFDLSRLAVAWSETQRKRNRRKRGLPPGDVFTRGFSLTLWEYQDRQTGDRQTGEWREHKYRPRIRIKHVDSKRAFIGLAPTRARDRRDPQYGARFLDLKTFALTNRGHSLASLCETLGIEEGKAVAERHGVIDSAYIEYARHDVRAYVDVLEKLRAEFDRHAIDLLPERAQSPASIAKAYLREMGVTPLLDREPQLPGEILGQTMSAYYGGRTEVHIRKAPVPVVYVDFLSMYPTVNSLLGLWPFITAERIEVVDATAEVQALLDDVTLDDGFDPLFWPGLTFFAQIVPEGDVLPVRAEYDGSSFTIGVNPLTADRPLWYAGPDLVASTLLTGKAPKVVQAFKLVPHGTLSTLRPVNLAGVIPIDPRADDFFRFVIEERRRVKQAQRRGDPVPEHLDPFLKVLANSGGYGIFRAQPAGTPRRRAPSHHRVQFQ